MNILLVAGGWSSERAVSLSGAAQIGQALTALGHKTRFFDPALDFPGFVTAASACDFAFINLHGAPGEDGLLQALLDAASVPYQGSGPAGSFLALNKAASKQLFVKGGIATAAWTFLPSRPATGYRPVFPPPYFVKPNLGGSSLAMSLVKDEAALPAALEAVFSTGDAALIEPALTGPEITCAVLGDAALPPILIRPKAGEFFNYESKYTDGAAEEICPAPIPPELTEAVKAAALAAHRLLGLSGYSRSDFIHTEAGLMLLEVNTLPGMTPTSLVPRAAKAAGMSFTDLIARLIELGLAERRGKP